jgi:hypothetical protein
VAGTGCSCGAGGCGGGGCGGGACGGGGFCAGVGDVGVGTGAVGTGGEALGGEALGGEGLAGGGVAGGGVTGAVGAGTTGGVGAGGAGVGVGVGVGVGLGFGFGLGDLGTGAAVGFGETATGNDTGIARAWETGAARCTAARRGRTLARCDCFATRFRAAALRAAGSPARGRMRRLRSVIATPTASLPSRAASPSEIVWCPSIERSQRWPKRIATTVIVARTVAKRSGRTAL